MRISFGLTRGMAHSPTMITDAMLAEGMQFPKMDGRFVFKNAVTRMPEVIREGLAANELTTLIFLFHQANMRINEFVAGHLKSLPKDLQQYSKVRQLFGRFYTYLSG